MNQGIKTLPLVLTISSVLLTMPMVPALSAELDTIRGVVKARDEAVYSVNLEARVMELPYRTGESFSKGDTLVLFDCQEQLATVKAAQAIQNAANATHKSNIEMVSYGAVGKYEVSVSKAKLNQAVAEAEVALARTKNCLIEAPYDGKISELGVNVHETPGPEQPLMKIVGINDYELRLIVPSSWLSWLTAGTEFTFAVDEVGRQYPAAVKQIGAEVDAVSKTIQIIAQFKKNPAEVLPGMSGTARFTQPAG